MPYLFEDGMFEIIEDITIDGVHYSFTPVLADMENPYSIDPDKMITNASYAYVKVIVNQKIITPQGEEIEEEYHMCNVGLGEDLKFYLDPSSIVSQYNIEEITLIVDGKVITPDNDGFYCLTNLQNDTIIDFTLKLSEKSPNTPTPNDPAQNENASDNSNTNTSNNTIEQVENAKTGDVAIMGVILLALICGIVAIVFAIKKRNKK